MELNTLLKQRLYELMSDDEKIHPFSFAERVGLSKSTFHSIWTKGSTSIHRSTAKKIADATGADIDWVHKGIGKAYPHEGRVVKPLQDVPISQAKEHLLNSIFLPKDMRTLNQKLTDHLQARSEFNPDYIVDALDILDEVEGLADFQIDNHTKAELIIQICGLLNSEDGKGAKNALSAVMRKVLKAS
ncbi:helix-turn-helix domain-containing protein [Psychrobacter pygoscelis]|uniref:helix-turn-helix domain-containing protein n=2 Tax=Psychrobacter TaxID=497 RepID=UPI001039D169|nr:helix-turn-helix transcriptional regulator [Psychrobacter pygoscelis]